MLEKRDHEVTYDFLENILKIRCENKFNSPGEFNPIYQYYSDNYFIVIDPNGTFDLSNQDLLYNYTEVEDKPVFYKFPDIKLTKDEVDENVFSTYRVIKYKENFRFFLVPIVMRRHRKKFKEVWEKLVKKEPMFSQTF